MLTQVGLITCGACSSGSRDHLRPSDAFAQKYLDVQQGVQLAAHQSCTSCQPNEECGVLCVRISDERHGGVFVPLHDVAGAPMTFNGTVEQLCPVTFRLTNLSQLMCCGAKTGIRANVSAQCVNAR